MPWRLLSSFSCKPPEWVIDIANMVKADMRTQRDKVVSRIERFLDITVCYYLGQKWRSEI